MINKKLNKSLAIIRIILAMLTISGICFGVIYWRKKWQSGLKICYMVSNVLSEGIRC